MKITEQEVQDTPNFSEGFDTPPSKITEPDIITNITTVEQVLAVPDLREQMKYAVAVSKFKSKEN